MKKLLSLLLLTAITVTAYADKNNKAIAKSNVTKPQQEQTVTPANNPASTDTAWHGTGKEGHYEFRQRGYDTRMGRYGYVDIDSATAAKYGYTRPTMPVRSSNPYQGITNKPVKLDK